MSKMTPNLNRGRVDAYNSSSTPLGIGAVFTGSAVNILAASILAITVATDQDSATDGLEVQQSIDGTNWDHTDVFTILGAKHKIFTINPVCKYYRIVYTNGSVAQTYFRLQSILKPYNIKPTSHRTVDDITTEDDAELVKSILMTKANDLNEFKNIEFNNPMPINGDQLYPHDVNLTYSDMHDFSGSPIDLLDNRWSVITDTTANNPKYLELQFERPIQTSIIGIAAISGSFSNTVIKYGLTGTGDITLLDESADSTVKNVLIAPSIPITLSYLKFEFHTANTITLSTLNLAKSRQSISQIQGIDDDGDVVNFGATRQGNFKVSINEYGDTPSIDAFDRLRTSNPFTIYDSKQLYDDQPLFYDESLGGSASSSHSTSDARTRLTVTASSSDFGIRQTKQRFNYQPGKSLLYLATFYSPQQTGVTSRIGSFDGTGTNNLTANNGIFFQIDDTNLSWNIAKNGSTTETAIQSNWNIDTLDGSGDANNPSGIELNIDSVIIILYDIEYLGVGRLRVGFVIDGIIRYCHHFNHANDPSFTSVYMSTPNLPIRYDVVSDGSGGGTLDHICATCMSEGGQELTGISRSIDSEGTHVDCNAAGTTYVILAIRLKSTHLDLTILPSRMTMISETNDNFRWSLLLNPTYAGTLTYADITNSGLQRALGATANTVSAEGVKLASGYALSAGSIESAIVNNLRIGSLIDGTRDELILACTPRSANADILGSLIVRELL